MSYYLILQYPYNNIELALCKNGTILNAISEHKFKAVSSTIPNMNKLLEQHNLTLSNIDFIGINVGPGPYNTLRALLTMANGIHFVKNIPLVSSNALELLETEYKSEQNLTILTAFMNHVFYRYSNKNMTIQKGCNLETLIEFINTQKGNILTIGNGAITYRDQLIHSTSNKLIFLDPIPEFNQLKTLATISFEKYKKNQVEPNYVQPLYFDQL